MRTKRTALMLLTSCKTAIGRLALWGLTAWRQPLARQNLSRNRGDRALPGLGCSCFVHRIRPPGAQGSWAFASNLSRRVEC